MSESANEHLLNHLRDMQAIEFHAQRQLARLAGRATDEDLEAICAERLEQTKEHEQRVQKLVEAQGHEPSALEDKTLRAGAIGLRQLADIAPDTPPRVAIQLFGLQQLEIAGFELLQHIAERESDEEAATAAREILEDKRKGAEQLPPTFDRAAELQVEQQEEDDESDREKPLLGQLTEIHALEEQSLQLLHIAASEVCQDEEFEQLLQEHREKTQEHERLITERIEAHDAHPSAVRDLHMGTARSGLRDLRTHPPDAYVKLAMNLCCLLQIQAAAYSVLHKVAELSDDGETAEVAEKISGEKRESAETVQGKFEHTIELMYSSEGSYEGGRRAAVGEHREEPSPASD
jgi:ferritin-like metal-binding protein YciE